MAHVVSYSHFTTATLTRESFDEAWFAIQSWKGYLQSFPGYLGVRLAARPLEDGNIHFHVATDWEHVEQLEEWLHSHWSASALLKSLRHPATNVVEENYEIFA